MLNDTESSKLLRQAYVQHIISKYLCYRIFQPFLFSLGKRYDKADTFFQAMSNQLREKSTRKEAVWRHYTLLAGYTTSNAKKNQQVAAAQVIEEIAAYVKPFADHKKMDIVTSGITRIVKYAVETWRYARMEREIITASMDDGGEDVANPEYWTAHEWELGAPPKKEGNAHVVMILLPVFMREGTLPSLHRPTAQLDQGIVYSKGVALYSDCAPVLQRKQELDSLEIDIADMEEPEPSVIGVAEMVAEDPPLETVETSAAVPEETVAAEPEETVENAEPEEIVAAAAAVALPEESVVGGVEIPKGEHECRSFFDAID
jgi:hypothetical protein